MKTDDKYDDFMKISEFNYNTQKMKQLLWMDTISNIDKGRVWNKDIEQLEKLQKINKRIPTFIRQSIVSLLQTN